MAMNSIAGTSYEWADLISRMTSSASSFRVLIMSSASSPFSTPSRKKLHIRGYKIEKDLILIDFSGNRSHGDSQLQIFAAPPLTVSPLSMCSFSGLIDGMKPEIGQRIDALRGDQKDASPVATTATIRTATRNAAFPPEADTAVATLACSEGYFDLVDKHIERSAILLGWDD